MLNASTIKNTNDKKDKVFLLEFKVTEKSTLLHFLDFYIVEIYKKHPLMKKFGSQLKINVPILTFKQVNKLFTSEKYSDLIKNFNLEIVFALSCNKEALFTKPSFLVV